MDFYFLTSLINMFWQIFTILFVLYRFTSFFSMMYNFILFLGKLLKGVYYVKDQVTRYISKKRGYSYLNEEEVNGLYRTNTSWYDKIKSWIFGNPRRTNIPLYETRTSFVHNMGNSTVDFNSPSPRSSQPDLDFEQTMMNSSQYESSEFYVNKHLRNSSIYPPPPHRRTQSHPSSIYPNYIKDVNNNSESSANHSYISIQTPTSTPTPVQPNSNLVHPTPQKPFNVEDSNMLFNSHFLTKLLHPFSSEETEKDDKYNDNKYNDNDNKYNNNKYNDTNDTNDTTDELEKALLSSEYNEV